MSVALAYALTIAFFEVGKQIAQISIVKPSLERGLGKFTNWLTSGYDKEEAKEKASEELRDLHLQALDQLRADTPDAFDRLKITNWVTGKDTETHQLMAAAAIEMVILDPSLIPDKLLTDLSIDDTNRELFAQYLFALRNKLIGSNTFSQLIIYANTLHMEGLLAGLTSQMAEVASGVQENARYLKQLVSKDGLFLNDEDALNEYLDLYRERWCQLSLPIIRKNQGIFSKEMKRIFVPLNVRDQEIEKKSWANYQEIKPRNRLGIIQDPDGTYTDFFKAFNTHSSFILIGLPGSGKSTLFRRIALAFAENRAPQDIHWEGGQKLPIFIRLRNFSFYLENNKEKFSEPCAGALIAYLDQHLRNDENIPIPNSFFEKRIQDGNCVVLLDGLDEVQGNRVTVAQYVYAFINKYKGNGNRIGISSRPKGYEGDTKTKLVNANLAFLEVLPLDKEKISLLIKNVLPLMETNQKIQDKDLEKLSRRIGNNENLLEIASIPLFCSALVQVYKYHGAELPQRRVDVLEEISYLLLGFWYSQSQELLESEILARHDGTESLYEETEDSNEIKFKRLSHLAYQMQTSLQSDKIGSDEAILLVKEYLIEHEGVLAEKAMDWSKGFLRGSHIHSGLFVEYVPGTYSFLHKNFMEYFAASFLLSRIKDPLEKVIEYLDDPWWEEVLLFAVAHPKATEVFREELIPAIIESIKKDDGDLETMGNKIIIAGKMANDMTTRLPSVYKEKMITTLVDTATNADFSPNTRANCADLADELGYEPADLYSFVPIPNKEAPDFLIARYPVTNGQYERFLKSENFTNKELWTDFPIFSKPDDEGNIHRLEDTTGNDGWEFLIEQAFTDNEGILYPRRWQDNNFGIRRKNAPVDSISCFEANAYCRWLLYDWKNQKEGEQGFPKPEEIRLPTDNEWTIAAKNIGNGKYPWGNLSKKDDIIYYANTEESRIGQTTLVWMYEKGQSKIYKIMDMAGNAWEWQAFSFDKNHYDSALRGGSWRYSGKYAGGTYRNSYFPNNYVNDFGFRILLCLSSSSPKSRILFPGS